jgi:hypothetical protein
LNYIFYCYALLDLYTDHHSSYSWVDEDTDYDNETVFWSKPDFLKIMESFQLPKRFTQMISRYHCLFAEFPPQKSAVEKDRYGRLKPFLSIPS